MKAFIYPYLSASESCKALAEGLGLKRIAHKASRFKGAKDRLVINWGASKLPEEVTKCTILNLPQAVKQASDKLLAFRRLNDGKRTTRAVYAAKGHHDLRADHEIFEGVADDFVGIINRGRYGEVLIKEPAPQEAGHARTPEFTTERMRAGAWLGMGFTVVERHILNGHSGAGIRLVEPDSEEGLQKCPLYVRYVPKKQEYRVHVCGGQAVDIQRKARRKDVADDDINWKIRNHDNGFIFARNEDGVVPPDVIVQAVKAVNLLGLAFGAVDVIFNDKEQKAYVLEVNTAPGLSGSTLEGYLSRFKDYLNGNVVIPAQNVPKEFVGAEEKVVMPVAIGLDAPPIDLAALLGKPKQCRVAPPVPAHVDLF
jgi:hypothetical protein